MDGIHWNLVVKMRVGQQVVEPNSSEALKYLLGGQGRRLVVTESSYLV